MRTASAAHVRLLFFERWLAQFETTARILIIAQAPGVCEHTSGVPSDQVIEQYLRNGMDASTNVFYDDSRVAIVLRRYCCPNRKSGGALPPRPECARSWLE